MPDLSGPSLYFRSTAVRGQSTATVDRDGGEHGAGIIRGVAVITRGEALGHGVWIDREFLHQSVDAINAAEKGTKSRFTHPGLSGDGLGKYLGRVRAAEVDGDIVRADLHISPTAHDTPDGNLAEYVMDLAEIEPDMVGLSIVFESDTLAEQDFRETNPDSPDPAHANNLPHARLSAMRAVDVVDEPAANPAGLFHRGDEIAAEADALLSFALGMSSDKPTLTQLDIDPGRVAGFVARFLDRHGLELKSKETTKMSDAETIVTDEVVEDVVTDEVIEDVVADDDDDAEVDADAEVEADPEPEAVADPEPSEMSDGQRFLDAFGDQGGVWFAEGKTFPECRELYTRTLEHDVQTLRAENDRLKTDLAAGEDEPLTFSDADPAADEISKDARSMGRTAAVLRRAIRISNN